MGKNQSINVTGSSVSGNIVTGNVSGNVEANTHVRNTFSTDLQSLLELVEQLDTSKIEQSKRVVLETNVGILEQAAIQEKEPSNKTKAALSAIKSVLSNTAGSTAAAGILDITNRLMTQL